MNHLIISCTKQKLLSDTLLCQSITSKLGNKIPYIIRENNKEGLSKIYNHYYDMYKDKYDSLIFVHDDVEITDPNWLEKLEEGYKSYDIVGLAGGLNPKLQIPILWHIMCGKPYLHGKVGHIDDQGSKFETNFGPTPSRVCILDGLFFAINLEKVRKTNWRFDERFDFHCYDIDASLTANSLGLKLGVCPIMVYHRSPGLRDINDPTFQKNQKLFLEKYLS